MLQENPANPWFQNGWMVHCTNVKKKHVCQHDKILQLWKLWILNENTPMGIAKRCSSIQSAGFPLDFNLTRVSKRISSVCQSFLQCLTQLIRCCTGRERELLFLAASFPSPISKNGAIEWRQPKGPSPPHSPSLLLFLPAAGSRVCREHPAVDRGIDPTRVW